MYIYVYIYVYVYMYIYVCMYVYVYMYIYVCIYVYVYIYIYTVKRTGSSRCCLSRPFHREEAALPQTVPHDPSAGSGLSTWAYIYIHAYIHTYIHTHIHTYIHRYIARGDGIASHGARRLTLSHMVPDDMHTCV